MSIKLPGMNNVARVVSRIDAQPIAGPVPIGPVQKGFDPSDGFEVRPRGPAGKDDRGGLGGRGTGPGFEDDGLGGLGGGFGGFGGRGKGGLGSGEGPGGIGGRGPGDLGGFGGLGDLGGLGGGKLGGLDDLGGVGDLGGLGSDKLGGLGRRGPGGGGGGLGDLGGLGGRGNKGGPSLSDLRNSGGITSEGFEGGAGIGIDTSGAIFGGVVAKTPAGSVGPGFKFDSGGFKPGVATGSPGDLKVYTADDAGKLLGGAGGGGGSKPAETTEKSKADDKEKTIEIQPTTTEEKNKNKDDTNTHANEKKKEDPNEPTTPPATGTAHENPMSDGGTRPHDPKVTPNPENEGGSGSPILRQNQASFVGPSDGPGFGGTGSTALVGPSDGPGFGGTGIISAAMLGARLGVRAKV